MKVVGKLVFDPVNVSKKHVRQSSWKRVAMVTMRGDFCKYYAWFIQKRFGVELNLPIRRMHLTFVNDKNIDQKLYYKVKDKWNGKLVEVEYNPQQLVFNGEHWWVRCRCDVLNDIRKEMGLGRYIYGYHLTVGRMKENFVDIEYLKKNYKKYYDTY